MLSLFCAALTENKILFYSSSYAQLTNATQAMLALMYPLKFRLVRNEALPRECFTRNNFDGIVEGCPIEFGVFSFEGTKHN